MRQKITNWNNFPVRESNLLSWKGEKIIPNGKSWIARGMGRCYGDASLSEKVYSTLKYNLILEFNRHKGLITCQSGVTLKDLLEIIVPAGWFLPVSPGTKFITVGGAVASDVHGKNHHGEGSFGDHVKWILIQLGTGEKIKCSLENNSELFWATRGGMGLTGMIDSICFQLKPIQTAFIKQKQIKAKNLAEIIHLFEAHPSATYSMAWIDCLKGGENFGRSILMLGEHALENELPKKHKEKPLVPSSGPHFKVPFNFPAWVLNSWSIKAFNALFYAKNTKREQESIVHYEGFFYPLDAISNWNRMYGKKGFVQYQFVLPLSQTEVGLKAIMTRIREKGWGSFLAVLKLFGPQKGMISFPMEGYTLALDFPMQKGLLEFLDELDQMVVDYGGRIYLSKDARMKGATFWKSYPNAKEFYSILEKINPNFLIKSDLARRIFPPSHSVQK